MKDKRNFFQRMFNTDIPEAETKNKSYYELLTMGKAQWSMDNPKKYIDEAYQKNVIAYRCAKEIADNIGTLQWQVFNKSTGKEQKKHPILDLLQRPNPLSGKASFFAQIEIFKQITGNTFIHVVKAGDNGKPQELYVLPSQYVNVKAGTRLSVGRYEYKPNEKTIDFPVNQITGQSDLLHYKFYNPNNMLWGQSPLTAAAYSVDLHNEASEWNYRLLKNGLRPGGILTLDKSLDEQQRDELKKSLMDGYSGGSNAGKPMVLEGGIKWQDISISPKDMDYLESKNTSAREVATAFRIPPMLLNINGDNTYANMAEARLSLWEDTLIPEADCLRDELNNWLVPMFGDNIRLDYNKDKIVALTTRREKVWYAISAATFLTLNEQRKAAGYEPLDGGDELPTSSPTQVTTPPESDESPTADDEVDNTVKSEDKIEKKVTKDITGKKEQHSHEYDAKESGTTSVVDNHSHNYTIGADKTGIADGHSHPLK